MPNYCENFIVFEGHEDKLEVIRLILLDAMDARPERNGRLLHSLIPEPDLLNWPEDEVRPDIRDWRRIHWGCSSEAYDYIEIPRFMICGDDGHGEFSVAFTTSWSPVRAWVDAVCEKYGVTAQQAWCVEYSRESAGFRRNGWENEKDLRDFYMKPYGVQLYAPEAVRDMCRHDSGYFSYQKELDWDSDNDL